VSASALQGERPASHRPRRALCKPELRRKGKGRDQTGRSQRDESAMMKRETFPIAKIYVPAKRRATLDVAKAREIAESILKDGQQTPIMVRRDGDRFVLVEGLHRLEACKQLGEETILGYLVQARLH
jgi:sulfiredoxin